MFHRGLPLHCADVRATHHADSTTAPRLTHDPFDRIETVLTFIVIRGQHTFRLTCAAAVLGHKDVAGFDPAFRCLLLSRAVIGSADQNHGGLRHFVIAVHVSGQSHAITHGNFERFVAEFGRNSRAEDREDGEAEQPAAAG